jgi:hypothetical protein
MVHSEINDLDMLVVITYLFRGNVYRMIVAHEAIFLYIKLGEFA